MIRIKFLLISFIGIFVLISCNDKFKPKQEIRTECKQGTEAVRKVLFVGWDGVRSDAILKAETPCIDSLLNSAYSNWHTDRGAYTVSVPGWSSLLHGVWPEKHGLTDNTFKTSNYKSYPDLFTLARQLKPNLSLATLSNWDDFLRITENENFAQRYTTDHDLKEATKYLLQDCTPDMTVLHFETPDAMGHYSGFSPTNSDYLKEITVVDAYLNELMKVVKYREQNYNEEWMVVVTTDHGGEGTGHGNQYDLDQTRFVWCILRIPSLSHNIELPEATSVDILPTMFKWMNIPLNPAWNLDGQALF